MSKELQEQKVAPQPPIDVIVLAHDRIDLTVLCIKALYENTKTPFHLVVVDNSKDPTPEYFMKLKKQGKDISLYHQDEDFICGNQMFNIGLSMCKHKYVATVMNSVRVEPDWELVALQLMEHDIKIGIIGFKCLFPNGLIESAGIGIDGYRCIDIGRNELSHRFTAVNEPPSLQWAFALLRKEAAIGNLDETIYHGFVGFDDIDNTLVLKNKGWKAVYCGMGVGFHSTHATRGSDEEDAQRKNMENAEIFYKRWGLWEEYCATNPIEMIKRDMTEIRGMLQKVLSPENRDDGQGKEVALIGKVKEQ